LYSIYVIYFYILYISFFLPHLSVPTLCSSVLPPPSLYIINFQYFFFTCFLFFTFSSLSSFHSSVSFYYVFFLVFPEYSSLIFIAHSLLSLQFFRFALCLSLFYIFLRSLLLHFTFRNPVLSIILYVLLAIISLSFSLSLSDSSFPSTVDLHLDLKVVKEPVAGFPPRSPKFITRAERVSVVQRMALRQILPQVLRLPLSVTFPPKLHIHSGKKHWARYSP
jgi:Zn-dependent protease with chaperone function